MNDKHTALPNEEPKYRKKSTAKGQSRSDHKHQYEVVLLTIYNHYNTFPDKTFEHTCPTEVCVVCGRIGDRVEDDSYYVKNSKDEHSYYYSKFDRGLSDKALALSKWYVNDFDKFAKPMDEGVNNNV